ncbi:LuxR family transcriptional regulator [Sphingomonas oligophenolica]
MAMRVLTSLAATVETLLQVQNRQELEAVLGALAAVLDFESYALLIPPDGMGAPGAAIVSEPLLWVAGQLHLDAMALLRRVSVHARFGFAWSEIPGLTPLTPADRRFLAAARAHGFRSGFTVPIYGPGALGGSFSFAGNGTRPVSAAQRVVAQSLAPFAWEAGRRLALAAAGAPPALTARQRECLLWAARGKTDWVIARILDIGEDTVESHLRQARTRYGVDKRITLIVRALFDGTLSFEEVLERA